MDFLLFSVLWGKWHTRMFVEYCLPSLLAPGNIPALQARKTTFAIYTDTDGINTIANSTIFKALSSVVDVEFMNLATLAQRDPAYMDKINWQMHSLHQARKRAADAGRIFINIVPDLVFGDGSLRYMGECFRNGAKIFYGPMIRVSAEPFMTAVSQLPHFPNIPASELGKMIVSHLHPLMCSYVVGSDHFPRWQEYLIWIVPNGGFLFRYGASQIVAYNAAESDVTKDYFPAIGGIRPDIVCPPNSYLWAAAGLTEFAHLGALYNNANNGDPAAIAAYFRIFDAPDTLFAMKRSYRVINSPLPENKWQRVDGKADAFVARIWFHTGLDQMREALKIAGFDELALIVSFFQACDELAQECAGEPFFLAIPRINFIDIADQLCQPQSLAVLFRTWAGHCSPMGHWRSFSGEAVAISRSVWHSDTVVGPVHILPRN